MGGIAMIVYPALLWMFVYSGKIDRWSIKKGRIIGLSLLAIALFLQFFWSALVIEGWQFRGPFQTESYLLQSLVDGVSRLLSFGRKTGWLFVAMTAIICLHHAWRLSFANRWLILSAAWISTFTLIGSLLEFLVPISAYVYFGERITQEQSAMIAMQQIVIWLVLLAILYIVLIRTSTKPSSP